MTERYYEVNKNGHNIRCKLYCEKGKSVKYIIVCIHGFAGHKDNASFAKFADRMIGKHPNVALVCFDLPCHGKDVKKKLSLEDCYTYLKYVTEEQKFMHPDATLFGFGVSFGGYLLLSYMHRYGSPFSKAVLRSPALNMYESFTTKILTEDDLLKLRKGKTVSAGFDRTVDIDADFLASVQSEDIRAYDFLEYAENLLVVHGEKDEIVPCEESERFCDNNIIECVKVPMADHRFQNPLHLEVATKATLRFFGL